MKVSLNTILTRNLQDISIYKSLHIFTSFLGKDSKSAFKTRATLMFDHWTNGIFPFNSELSLALCMI